MIGTGRLLDDTDIADGQRQTLYAIADGTATTLPSLASPTLTRNELNNNNNPLTGIGSTPASAMGWYYDLGGRAPLTGTVLSRERISLNPKASQGFVTWVGNVPDTNACNPNGLSRQYATTYGGGKSLLYTEVAGVRTYQSYTETRALVKSQLVNVGDGVRILGTDDKGVPFLIGNPLNAFGSGRLLNWREILQ